jgi:hypothetical protein
VRSDARGDTCLVAWIVATGDTAPLREDLRATASTVLSDYMSPSRYVFVDALPRLASGKIDVRALTDTAGATAPSPARRNGEERELVQLWEEMLGTTGIDIEDNFFDLGGHSLLAVHLALRMSELLGREVRCQDVMAHGTIAGIVAAARG